MSKSDHARRTLRSDAERNRESVVSAARAVFRELGADAPMTEIARRAGVGTATLYRRFPTRDDLLGYVFADRLGGCVDMLQAARSNPDPWQGLVDYISYVVDLQLRDRAFSSVFFRRFPPDSPIGRSRRESRATLRTLISAAKAAGALRQDVDAPCLLFGGAEVLAERGVEMQHTVNLSNEFNLVFRCAGADAADGAPAARNGWGIGRSSAAGEPRSPLLDEGAHRLGDVRRARYWRNVPLPGPAVQADRAAPRHSDWP